MDNLIKQLEAFVPYNEQEERDLSVMLDLAKSGADVLTRKNKRLIFPLRHGSYHRIEKVP